jgi:hypothetical protein
MKTAQGFLAEGNNSFLPEAGRAFSGCLSYMYTGGPVSEINLLPGRFEAYIGYAKVS